MSQALLEVRDLHVRYPIRGGLWGGQVGEVKAVSGVSFSLNPGESLAVVGESGCGKSTLGNAILGLTRPTEGEVLFEGEPLSATTTTERRALAAKMQVVWQDPVSALDPKMTVGQSLAEPLEAQGRLTAAQIRARVAELLTMVGLHPDHAARRPHEFSGGQRQRLVIGRALAAEPKLLVLDEPVSALDVSIRSQILNLLLDLQKRLGLAYLFISHDLSVVRHFADRVAVMYLGKIVESGPAQTLFAAPRHPYSQALLSAVPLPQAGARARRSRILLTGDLPSPANPPAGCVFSTRCPIAEPGCSLSMPPLVQGAGGTALACHLRAPQ
ncbi:ABC transporter ATP-binding protein [Falsigemmobacter faecalis]|uniref:ATP-binding cassette domain-containing protein n=1 Tax=Falsigemmobacter faecalis TaxID=2488730 RepID=A0A3P3DRP0_9RHOB|nr:oligopeptide/dipeptide ABC transporter ATP-binding protein [Falsigemmobacter faecalis]RRH76356.1 ATP-binding cassette domain-containing protein [Falsigemmobacter faecalis]